MSVLDKKEEKSVKKYTMKDYETKLDQEDISKLVVVMKEIEKKNGKRYELFAKEFDKNQLSVYSFSDRGPFTIKMKENYTELDGVYETVSSIDNKIKELFNASFPKVTNCYKCNSVVQDNGERYDCEKCGKWRLKNPDMTSCSTCKNPVANNKWESVAYCKQCNCYLTKGQFESKWRGVAVSLGSGTIYYSGGGSLSICHEIGKVTF